MVAENWELAGLTKGCPAVEVQGPHPIVQRWEDSCDDGVQGGSSKLRVQVGVVSESPAAAAGGRAQQQGESWEGHLPESNHHAVCLSREHCKISSHRSLNRMREDGGSYPKGLSFPFPQRSRSHTAQTWGPSPPWCPCSTRGAEREGWAESPWKGWEATAEWVHSESKRGF